MLFFHCQTTQISYFHQGKSSSSSWSGRKGILEKVSCEGPKCSASPCHNCGPLSGAPAAPDVAHDSDEWSMLPMFDACPLSK
jgi:hypothetical protein